MIEVSKITSKGQITMPIEIRKMLGLKTGDKVVFFVDDNGKITIFNARSASLKVLQEENKGIGKEIGILTDEDAVEAVNEYRNSKK